MNIMKKCLLFVGLIGIMGAIKTEYVFMNVKENISQEEKIAEITLDKNKKTTKQRK